MQNGPPGLMPSAEVVQRFSEYYQSVFTPINDGWVQDPQQLLRHFNDMVQMVHSLIAITETQRTTIEAQEQELNTKSNRIFAGMQDYSNRIKELEDKMNRGGGPSRDPYHRPLL